MPSGIKCAVEECTHNKNKLCQASAIEVKSANGKNVARSDDTCCETFQP